MNRIRGKTALVTGASAGIGRACARALAERGADLVLAARRGDRLEELGRALEEEHGVEVRTRSVDVRERAGVQRLAEGLASEGVFVELLINNAGLARGREPVHEGDPRDWDEMIDTNVKGLLYVTRSFLPPMVEKNRGHVVYLGSIAGYQAYPGGNVYNATKYAVRGLTDATNMDLLGTRVRVTGIEPGMVETEFSEVRYHGDAERARKVYRGFTPLTGEDVADAICYVMNAPEHMDVVHMVILPTDQRSSYHVHRGGGGGAE